MDKIREKRGGGVQKGGLWVLMGIATPTIPSFLHLTLQSPTGVKSQVPMEGCNSKEQHGKCGIKEDAGRKTNTI